MADLRWWRESTPLGPLLITCGDFGVCRIDRDGDPPELALEDCDTEVQDQLQEYFRGERRAFTVPYDLTSVSGPAMRAILETLARTVPYGTTIGYGALAERAGHPGAARAVGQAMARNPIPLLIPCHRVIGANGVIGGFGWGLDAKRSLLAREGLDWL
jgi:methylated-DNA-[protein]-cysteine S-methyltransferase